MADAGGQKFKLPTVANACRAKAVSCCEKTGGCCAGAEWPAPIARRVRGRQYIQVRILVGHAWVAMARVIGFVDEVKHQTFAAANATWSLLADRGR